MQKISLSAHAKINLSLDILSKRPDGYHDMRMIMQSIALSDRLTLEKNNTGTIKLDSDLKFLPKNGKNLAERAAELFFEETGISSGVSIRLRKSIPVSAGLAGGSTDAAAVLRAMNILFETGLSQEELCVMGKKLGADIPFCIVGGTALVEGIGEQITPLPPMPDCHIVLCKPRFGVSTAYVFSKINVAKLKEHPDTKGIIAAIEENDLTKLSHRLYNVMESVTAAEHAKIGEIKTAMLDCGALGCAMSGSGPTVFGLFDKQENAQTACQILRRKHHFNEVYLTAPCGSIQKTEMRLS